jgi:hypothetical protein
MSVNMLNRGEVSHASVRWIPAPVSVAQPRVLTCCSQPEQLRVVVDREPLQT